MLLILLLSMLVVLLNLSLPTRQVSGSGANIPLAAEETRADQAGPPWFNQAWNYRKPVVITNTGQDWLYYQVLIILDDGNFDFDLAQADGADVRFTLGEGTILIPYWIEAWDSINQLAYVWLRVPDVEQGETTIYLYFNNPTASPGGDGESTFDGFDDDWDLDQFAGEGFNLSDVVGNPDADGVIKTPITWSVIEGSPEVSPGGELILENGEGIASVATYQNLAVGFRASFGAGAGNEWIGFYNESTGKRAMIGDLPADPTNLYLRNYNTGESNILIPRVAGDWHGEFHIYEVRWCLNPGNCDINQTLADIDHGLTWKVLTTQVPGTELPVTLHNNNTGTASTLLVDWIYVRKYSNIEPSVWIGEKQGLVELGISMSDFPDPLPIGNALTYQLVVMNTGTINAPGVVVTDTLPGSVEIGPVSPSQGNCGSGGIFVCDLGMILSNSVASITVVVTPTVDGVITNTAEVGSPGYELDLSDNQYEEPSLVDSAPPVVNWESPVENGGTYVATERLVLLEASASDNDQVASVEFKFWDHNGGGWMSIGTDNTYPYQVFFDIDAYNLEPFQVYQTFVVGTDRAGNESDPYNPLQRIFIVRRLSAYLPIMMK